MLPLQGKTPPNWYEVLVHDNPAAQDAHVESVLSVLFKLCHDDAHKACVTMRERGAMSVGVYTLDVACTKATEIFTASRRRGLPLAVQLQAH